MQGGGMRRRRLGPTARAAARGLLAVAAMAAAAGIAAAAWVGVRWLTRPPRATDDFAIALVGQDGQAVSQQRGKLRLELDPLTFYRNQPGQETASYTVNAWGCRGPLPPAGRPRLAVLGGSLAFGQGVRDDRRTFAALLDDAFPGAATVNAGTVGYLSGQELALMVQHLDGLQPTAYLTCDGWNDLFDQHFFWPRQESGMGWNSSFYMLEWQLAAFAAGRRSLPPQPPRMPGPADEEASFQRLVRHYVGNLVKMQAFATARGAKFAAVLQPELGAKSARSPTEEAALAEWNRLYGYVDRGFPAAYRRLRTEAAAALADASVPAFDAAAEPSIAEAAETLFLDPVHLNEAGHARLAAALRPFVARWLAPAAPAHPARPSAGVAAIAPARAMP